MERQQHRVIQISEQQLEDLEFEILNPLKTLTTFLNGISTRPVHDFGPVDYSEILEGMLAGARAQLREFFARHATLTETHQTDGDPDSKTATSETDEKDRVSPIRAARIRKEHWKWVQYAPLKIRKAFREQPEQMQAFIDNLPEPDTTIVGAEVSPGNTAVCSRCLTEQEKTGLENPESGISKITKDESDEQRADGCAYSCIRCGNPF